MPWTNEPSLLNAASGPAAASADAPTPQSGYRIYVLGGNNGVDLADATVQTYDTSTETWSTAPSMPTARLNLAAAGGPNRVYAIGGSDGTGPLATHEIFDPAGNDWTTAAPLSSARESLGATTGPDGLIYVFGGYDGSYLGVTEAYDPATGTWTSLPAMPTARSALAAVTGPNGLIYVIGGQDSTGPLPTVEVFDVTSSTWSTTTPLPSAVWALAAALGPDGLIYAFGGVDGNGFPVSTVYSYDPATSAWTTQDSLLAATGFLAGTTGPDGLIYALGGQSDLAEPVTTVEAFTTATAQTAPDPYIGNGSYQSPDIILLDATNTPIPIGGAPGGAWDTLLPPNSSFGLQAVVYNDSSVPATGTIVSFWHFPGGVGTAGVLIDSQTVTVPANGSLVVTSASPFQSGPPLAHECAVVAISCPTSPYFSVNPATGTEVIDPTVPHPGDSFHFGSAWRNTNSLLMGAGMGLVFPFGTGRQLRPFPLPVKLGANAVKVPAGWQDQSQVAAIKGALEFTGAASRVPLFLIPELRANLPVADLGLRVYSKEKPDDTTAESNWAAAIAGESGEFYVAGTIPADARPGDIYLLTVQATYPAADRCEERTVEYLEVIHIK
jgi:N-acetylneuraminic acid mutarotase